MKKIKFAIIGNPISHSLSPILHNYWFNKYNINAEYELLNIKEREIPIIINKIKKKEIKGINVTLPYKKSVIPFLSKTINDANETHSVNTIILNENDSLIGENTDVFGLQAAYLKEIDNAINKKALVVGAGGVSPSIILSLQKSGVKNISVTNRTSEKCIFLRKKFNSIKIFPWEQLKSELKNFDIIIPLLCSGVNNNYFNMSIT